VINDKLQGLKNDIEATKEFHRVGAISGVILDADGTTVFTTCLMSLEYSKKTLMCNLVLKPQIFVSRFWMANVMLRKTRWCNCP
jgi:hypothetical protein